MGPVSSTVSRQLAQRDDLIASHMAMATRIARSYAGRGEELDDLTRVAMLELVRAAGQFDPSHGAGFTTYAYPCIVGAVKKHFREFGWSLRVTRRVQELHLQTRRATPGLAQLLGRTPTVKDLAVHLQLSEKDINDGLGSHLIYKARSLDRPAAADGEGDLGQVIGGLDARLEAVTDRHFLTQQITRLAARERSVLRMRYIEDLTQMEIADRIGVSQMQVSRLLRRALKNLRALLLEPQDMECSGGSCG